ncbi:ferredoxin [Xenococcus sp. PCC 7305]|uniref:(2Fe-2S) ferredoxin domain-containing protein n=1 Tax=Xenococcus sp. PCC 7305 TaxID=102125 RepID=UPI0002AC188C|nr:(2Fe-2S) ferredoxin domain-containing protein [Xenococcus sp. PCC 7305]ELS03773.1 ferredoxin [Xenococcus sp. PCC 7305]
MTTIQPLVSEFTIVGKLEDLVIKSDRSIKHLQLSTKKEEYSVKVAKELRHRLNDQLKPGCWLKVTGMRKYEIHKGQVKYKAYKVELLPKKSLSNFASDGLVTSNNTKPKAKVLFCSKSTCWKKGGKSACRMLQTELENRGIADQVQVKTVGCLKQCKKAPNIVVMPDKARYQRVSPKQVPLLIEKHLLVN